MAEAPVTGQGFNNLLLAEQAVGAKPVGIQLNQAPAPTAQAEAGSPALLSNTELLEAPKTPESLPNRKAQEIQGVAETAIVRRGELAQKKFGEATAKSPHMTPAERSAVLSPEEKADYTLFKLKTLSPKESITFSKGQGITVDPDGAGGYKASAKGSVEIVSIAGTENPGIVSCKKSDGTEVQIPRSVLVGSQLLSQAKEYRAGVKENPAMAAVLEAHLEGVATGVPGEVTEVQIAEAGKSLGWVSADSTRALIKASGLPDAEVARLEALTQGKNIMDPQSLGEILHAVDKMPQHIQTLSANVQAARDRLSQLRIALTMTSGEVAQTIQQQIRQVETEIPLLEAELKMYEQYPKTPGALSDLLIASYGMNLPPDKARRIDDFIRSNNVKGFVESILPEIDEKTEKGRQLKKMVEAATKLGSIGAIVILAMLVTQAVKA